MFVDTGVPFFVVPTRGKHCANRKSANIPEAFLQSCTFTVSWNYFERERKREKHAELWVGKKMVKIKSYLSFLHFFRAAVMKHNAQCENEGAFAVTKIRFAYKVLSLSLSQLCVRRVSWLCCKHGYINNCRASVHIKRHDRYYIHFTCFCIASAAARASDEMKEWKIKSEQKST